MISTLRVVNEADFKVAVLASNFRPLVSMHNFLPNLRSCSPTTSPCRLFLLCLHVLAFLKKVLAQNLAYQMVILSLIQI